METLSRPAPQRFTRPRRPPGRFVGWLAAVAALAIACRGGSPAPRKLVVGLDGVPVTLDPHAHNDAVTWSLLANFYEGLVRFSAEMRLEPALASSWEQDGTTRWRFHLREGARFADGSPVTAGDVVASFERARSLPASRVRHHLVGIVRCTAAGDDTVVLETDGPRPTLLNRLPFLMVVPAASTGRSELEAIDGSGPYREESRDPGVAIDAVASQQSSDPTAVRRVRFVFSWSQRELADRFLAGGIDVLRQVPEADLPELRDRPGLRAELQPRLQVQMLSICPAAAKGATAGALADWRVRKALLLALDRARYAREVFRGNAIVATQAVQPVVFGYDPSSQAPPYDPLQAAALLRDAGYASGIAATLDYTAAQVELVLPIVRDLARVGVDVTLREVAWAELLRRTRAHESELSVFGWGCSTGDASDFLNACAHSPATERGLGAENYSGYADPATDELIERAEHELDPPRRLELLQEAQGRVLASFQILPLTVRFLHLGVADRVTVAPRYDQWLLASTMRWTTAEP